MTGRTGFGTLRAAMSDAQRAAADDKTRELKAELHLADLRRAREASQAELARALKVKQPAVARLEGRADMYVGTLRRYVEALGGKLEIVARFGDGEEVAITSFRDVGEPPPRPKPRRARQGAPPSA